MLPNGHNGHKGVKYSTLLVYYLKQSMTDSTVDLSTYEPVSQQDLHRIRDLFQIKMLTFAGTNPLRYSNSRILAFCN